jgi:hypothetical protein
MRRRIVIVFLLAFVAYFYSNPILKESFTILHAKTTGLEVLEVADKEVWIEVHDVSPAYLEKLEEVVDVLEKHPGAYSKVVLFIIPNHGGVTPMHAYPGFVGRIKELEEKGFVLGLHGYAHDSPMVKPEFKVSPAEAERLLKLAEEEFNASGLRFPSYFLPPGWQTTREVDELLRKRFQFVYYYYYIDSPRGIIPSQSLEYVWHGYSYKALKRAQRDYANLRGIVRLTIHLGAINNEEGLNFLRGYLGWLEEKSNIPSA